MRDPVRATVAAVDVVVVHVRVTALRIVALAAAVAFLARLAVRTVAAVDPVVALSTF